MSYLIKSAIALTALIFVLLTTIGCASTTPEIAETSRNTDPTQLASFCASIANPSQSIGKTFYGQATYRKDAGSFEVLVAKCEGRNLIAVGRSAEGDRSVVDFVETNRQSCARATSLRECNVNAVLQLKFKIRLGSEGAYVADMLSILKIDRR